ncbi:hypothetical protein COS75_00345 [Candidatus Pacearchaeota archaeon CG06_land_8_20_14_3_00_35_12]|nr:MAG: hypothetical protein COS75_00345 [Candidatus Pacearchaeota archaeon CG06_land_8_20_14_3_00_35_12]
MINVWLKNFTDKNFKPTEEGWKKALKKFLPNYKLDSKFFSENGKLRKDLTEAQFEEWQNYWFENLIGCKDFACVHDSETCGIARMCGDCSIYRTYKNGTFYSDGKTVTDWCDQVNHLSFDKKTGKWSLGLKDWEKEFPKKSVL